MPVAVHVINFRGLSGGIFITLALSLALYVLGFATTGWSVYRGYHEGLWMTCTTGAASQNQDWFRGVQAMITIGLIGLIVAFVIVSLYMCVHDISKNSTIIALVIVCFLSVLFMLLGFVIYGVKKDNLSWSFFVTVIASVLCLVAGILAVVQMRQSGVRM